MDNDDARMEQWLRRELEKNIKRLKVLNAENAENTGDNGQEENNG